MLARSRYRRVTEYLCENSVALGRNPHWSRATVQRQTQKHGIEMNPNRRRGICAAVFVACSAIQVHAQAPEKLWYYVDREDAWNSLQRNIAKISVLAPSSYGVDE